MSTLNLRAMLLYIVKNCISAHLALCGFVGVIGWIKGWNTVFQYGGGLVLAGMAVLVPGIFIASHHWRSTALQQQPDDSSEQALPGNETPSSGRLVHMLHSFRVPIHFIGTGLLAIAFGSVLQTLFS